MGRRWQEQFCFLAINIHDTHAIREKKNKKNKKWNYNSDVLAVWTTALIKGY